MRAYTNGLNGKSVDTTSGTYTYENENDFQHVPLSRCAAATLGPSC
jgi:hypothetical protein